MIHDFWNRYRKLYFIIKPIMNRKIEKMQHLSSYVFFDIETTGLPWQERNRTKITELSFVAVLRKDLDEIGPRDMPPVSKLTLMLNPQRKIHPEVTKLTGLSNDLLQRAPLFKDKIRSLISFLEDLPKPVCLVAHNGNTFDFKILLAECSDANTKLPSDLLCVDSLVGFRKLFKDKPSIPNLNVSLDSTDSNDLLTEDEDDWPDLNVSVEEWQEIDDICSSLSDVSFDDHPKQITKKNQNKIKEQRSKAIRKVFEKPKVARQSFALSPLYERLVGKQVSNAHRAEDDCFMLLECVTAMKVDFLPWADGACKYLSEIKPLKRN